MFRDSSSFSSGKMLQIVNVFCLVWFQSWIEWRLFWVLESLEKIGFVLMARPVSQIDCLNNLRGKAQIMTFLRTLPSYKEKHDILGQSSLLKSISKALHSIDDREKEKLLQTRFWMTSQKRKLQPLSFLFSHFVLTFFIWISQVCSAKIEKKIFPVRKK